MAGQNVRSRGRARRHRRVRGRISGTPARPRLAVARSNANISAQVIDDTAGHTLAAASTVEPGLRTHGGGKVGSAQAVGEAIAQRASERGVSDVRFDRGGNKYHGRVAALAEAARGGGLRF